MIKVKEVIIVEGRYDKIKLSRFVDGLIITTEGFGIFNNREKQEFIKNLAKTRGILVLTDSDGAGFVIRNFLKGNIPSGQIKHAYIPDILGKEKRKNKPSKEGKIGVEGMTEEVLCKAIEQSGAVCEHLAGEVKPRKEITKADFYEYGLTGCRDSSQRRDILKKALKLPNHLTSNSLLDVLNCTMGKEEFEEFCDKVLSEEVIKSG